MRRLPQLAIASSIRLLVMDEAQRLAPRVRPPACPRSNLMLVSQARKYGLGLIFATQAPKGLHNQIGERGDTVLRAAERAGVYRRGPGDGPL